LNEFSKKWERNAPLPGERLLSGRPRGGRRPACLDTDTRIRAFLGDGQTKAGAHKCAPAVWNAPKSAVSTDFRRSSRSTRAVGRHDRRGFPGFRACGPAASSAPAFGGANTKKENGIIVSEPYARSVQDDIDACRRRLIEAIKRKQAHDGSGCTLLIFAREYRFLLTDVNVAELVTDAVCQAGANSFERVCVVDEKFFWESA
jgi:hypothetical protein